MFSLLCCISGGYVSSRDIVCAKEGGFFKNKKSEPAILSWLFILNKVWFFF